MNDFIVFNDLESPSQLLGRTTRETKEEAVEEEVDTDLLRAKNSRR